MKLIFLLLICNISLAENYRDLTSNDERVDLNKLFQEKEVRPERTLKPKKRGNLPGYTLRNDNRSFRSSSPVLQKPKGFKGKTLDDVRRGDVLNAKIIENIKAYPGAKAPMRAKITHGRYKGSLVVGSLSFNPSTKNIVATFDTFRDSNTGQEYHIKASVLDQSGEEGIIGEYHSNRAKGFWASVLSGFISGYSRGSIRHEKTLLGYEKVPSEENYLKEGIAGAAEKTAKRYESEIYEEPVFTVAKAPIHVSIFIEEAPVLITNK